MSEYIVESRHTYTKTRISPNQLFDLGTSEWTKVPMFEHNNSVKNSFEDADAAREAIAKEQVWDSKHLKTSKYEYRILKDGEEYTAKDTALERVYGKIQELIDSKYKKISDNLTLISGFRKEGYGDLADTLMVKNAQIQENIKELKGLLK